MTGTLLFSGVATAKSIYYVIMEETINLA